MVEMLKVLRRGRRPDRLGCGHSRISHVIESAVVCSELELMAAHQSTRCVPDLDSVSLQLKKHLYQADVRLSLGPSV